jgi:hypothetical protein
MDQISIKLPKSEMDFLDWYTKKHAIPKASLYRDITLETFRQWKRNQLLTSFMKGEISIKIFCHLADFSFFEAMVFIEESGIEPDIPSIITEYTNNLTDENIKKHDLSIFKNNKPIFRSSASNNKLNDDFIDS